MSWWFVLLIIGIIAAGIITGLGVSFAILRARKKGLPFWSSNDIITDRVTQTAPVNEIMEPEPEMVLATKALETSKETVPAIHPIQDTRVEEYLDQHKISSASSNSPVSPKVNAFLVELENNLAIASKPVTNQLVNFHTDVWNTKRSELGFLSHELMGELNEAYVDMLLANNIVWLVMELGRHNKDITDNYLKLSTKITERLQRIIPSVRESLK